MMARCYRPDSNGYSNYGGRGISVCDRWHDFANFHADMGDRVTSGYSLDRLNNQLGYEPGNCRWATIREQADNKRTNVYVEAFGRRMTVSAWARERGMRISTLYNRLFCVKRPMTPEEALTLPPIPRGQRRAA